MEAVALDGRDAVMVPRWSNADAVSVIDAVTRALGKWDLAYQYAAPAYGWDPARDYLVSSQQQAEADYPVDLVALLIEAARALLVPRDKYIQSGAALTFDPMAWDAWLERVQRGLRDDGAEATFKVPVPACKGKSPFPRRDKNGKWKCDPILVDDPITAIGSSAAKLGAVVLVALIAYEFVSRPRRRR